MNAHIAVLSGVLLTMATCAQIDVNTHRPSRAAIRAHEQVEHARREHDKYKGQILELKLKVDQQLQQLPAPARPCPGCQGDFRGGTARPNISGAASNALRLGPTPTFSAVAK